MGLLLLAVLLWPTSALAQSPSPTPTPTGMPAPVVVDDSTPNAGQTIYLTGAAGACLPTDTVTFTIDTRMSGPNQVANAQGGFNGVVLVAETTTVGAHTLAAVCGVRTYSATLNVEALNAAVLAVSNATPTVGTMLTASGVGCGPSQIVTFTLGTTRIGPDGVSGNDGRFAANILIPQTATVGRQQILATCGTFRQTGTVDVRSAAGAAVVQVTTTPVGGVQTGQMALAPGARTATLAIFGVTTLAALAAALPRWRAARVRAQRATTHPPRT